MPTVEMIWSNHEYEPYADSNSPRGRAELIIFSPGARAPPCKRAGEPPPPCLSWLTLCAGPPPLPPCSEPGETPPHPEAAREPFVVVGLREFPRPDPRMRAPRHIARLSARDKGRATRAQGRAQAALVILSRSLSGRLFFVAVEQKNQTNPNFLGFLPILVSRVYTCRLRRRIIVYEPPLP